MGPLHTVGGSVKWYCGWGEQYRGGASKITNRTTRWSSNPPSGHSCQTEIRVWKRQVHAHIQHSTSHKSKDVQTMYVSMNASKPPPPKQWSIHTTEHYSALKKKETLTYVTTGVNAEDSMQSEINQARGHDCVIPLVGGI